MTARCVRCSRVGGRSLPLFGSTEPGAFRQPAQVPYPSKRTATRYRTAWENGVSKRSAINVGSTAELLSRWRGRGLPLPADDAVDQQEDDAHHDGAVGNVEGWPGIGVLPGR